MSAHLQWLVIRNNSSFMVKKRNIKKVFSTEPNNLKNLHSYKNSGIIHNKVIGITPAPDNKGFVISHKRRTALHQPRNVMVKTTIKHGARRALHSLGRFIEGSGYRRDMKLAALRRASAIIRSQKPITVKKRKLPPHKKPE